MMIYKKFSFWLTIIAIGICLFNLLGFDDKSILLFLASPPFQIMGTHWFVENVTHPANISIAIKYVLTILFWFIIGAALDKYISHLLKKHHAKE